MKIRFKNLGKYANYAARMKLFQQLFIAYDPPVVEHEEAGSLHNESD